MAKLKTQFNDLVDASSKANKTQENWIAPTLTNLWVNFGLDSQNAQYFKDEFGFVHLRGFVKSGTIGQSIFTLPVGYRPLVKVSIVCASNSAFGFFDVNTNGTIVPIVGSNAWISLSGTSFKIN
jgi:hypothetical protein